MRIQHMQKVTKCLILSKRSYCVFTPQGFVTKCFLIFIVDEVKNFAANNIFKLVSQSHTGSYISLVSHILGAVYLWLVTYLDPCKKCGIHILKSSEVLKQQKVSIISSSTRIVESRDKIFILDLKLLFIIVNCFSRRFPPMFFFTVKLVCFIGFLESSYLVLFTFPLCMILM